MGTADHRVGPVIAVVGPTASGKTDLALLLAEQFRGEIINADSMQLYRGMDIGTAKLLPTEWRGIPHHVLDIWDVTIAASVAEYQSLARETISAILANGKIPILVGGSGLYIRAVLDDLVFPGTNENIRARLEDELATVGAAELHARLSTVDPAAASAILPTNGRRIVRALEVIELTGQPFTATMPGYDARYDCVQIGLDTVDLDQRIDQRVDQMWEKGLVNEVQGLIPAGITTGRTASRALGYRQVLAFLADECDEEQAKLDTKQGTRKFARSQRSWFRRDPRIHWLDAGAPEVADQATSLVRRKLDQ